MKRIVMNKSLSKKSGLFLIILIGISGLLSSCIKDEPDTISTFTQEMMGEYLINHKAEYSEFS